MASWREIDRIRKDPTAFRALAMKLLKVGTDLTDWEKDFLASIGSDHDSKEFTTRQSEKLLQIRDDNEFVTKCRDGFSVALLLRQCREARLDLSESDEAWIEGLIDGSNSVSIKRKHVGRLLRCARQLHIIEEEFAS